MNGKNFKGGCKTALVVAYKNGVKRMKKQKIEIKRVNEIWGCYVCHAPNYDDGYGTPQADLIQFRVGGTLVCLCESCLRDLANIITEFLNE